MTQNGTSVVNGTPNSVIGDKDESHLIIVLTQTSYDAIKEVVDRATDRGLESSFEHWLSDAIKTGTNARLRTWNDRDVVTLYREAAKGNDKAKAKLAKLLHISQ